MQSKYKMWPIAIYSSILSDYCSKENIACWTGRYSYQGRLDDKVKFTEGISAEIDKQVIFSRFLLFLYLLFKQNTHVPASLNLIP